MPQLSSQDAGFLYSLLTSADARAIQRRSAFYASTADGVASSMHLDDELPQRSHSLTLHATHDELLEQRPSSVPHGPPQRRRQHHKHKLARCASAQVDAASGAGAVYGRHSGARPEPLDLCVRTDCSDSESAGQVAPCTKFLDMYTSAVQPMLCNILQQDAAPSTATSPSTHCTADTSMDSTGAVSEDIHEAVQLSRKQAHVLRARVANWLKEAVDFAMEKPVFVTLPEQVQLVLLRRAWPRLLLLSMAEHGCSFAVTACQRAADTTGDGDGGVAQSLHGAQKPTPLGSRATRAFAESLLRIIELAHSLGLDETAFNLLRLAVILKGDNEAEVHLNQVHSEILMYFYSHLKSIYRTDYFADVVQLLVVLSDIDKNMIENLLCGQLPDSSVDCFLDARFARR